MKIHRNITITLIAIPVLLFTATFAYLRGRHDALTESARFDLFLYSSISQSIEDGNVERADHHLQEVASGSFDYLKRGFRPIDSLNTGISSYRLGNPWTHDDQQLIKHQLATKNAFTANSISTSEIDEIIKANYATQMKNE